MPILSILFYFYANYNTLFVRTFVFMLIGIIAGGLLGVIITLFLESFFPSVIRLISLVVNRGKTSNWSNIENGIIFIFLGILLMVVGIIIGAYIGYNI